MRSAVLNLLSLERGFVSSPSSPSEAAPRQVPEELQHCMGHLGCMGAAATPAGQRGHSLLGKMTPRKEDLRICRAPAALAGERVLGRGAKAGSTRDLQDTGTAQSMTGMCCILLLDTAGLCQWGMLPLSVLLSPSPA